MIAVCPPEYFPRLEYMARVQAADRFVLADTFRYRKQTFQNRSRLRNPNGWQWISVPLRARQHGRPIDAVAVNEEDPWQAKHWRAFQYNYRSTPYFEYFEDAWQPFFERTWTSLAALTVTSTELLHRQLGLSTPLMRASSLPGRPDTVERVLQALEAEALLLPAEMDMPEIDTPDAAAEWATYRLQYDAPQYRQNFDGFEPGMSAADVLFNYGPEAASIIARGAQVVPVVSGTSSM